MLKLSTLIGGALLSQAFIFGANAQEQGPGLQPPPAYHKATPEEKAAGRAQRRQEGRAAAKDGNTAGGEVTKLPVQQAKVSKAEREEARAARKAETKRAAKAGELAPSGEVGATK